MKQTTKIYLGAVARALIAIQLLGLIIGTPVMCLSVEQTSEGLIEDLACYFFIMFMGLLVTILPTVIYSFALPGVIIGMRALGHTRKFSAYMASAVLTTVFLAVVSMLFLRRDLHDIHTDPPRLSGTVSRRPRTCRRPAFSASIPALFALL